MKKRKGVRWKEIRSIRRSRRKKGKTKTAKGAKREKRKMRRITEKGRDMNKRKGEHQRLCRPLSSGAKGKKKGRRVR